MSKENELANLRILSSKFAETKMQMKDDIEAEEKAVVLMEKQIDVDVLSVDFKMDTKNFMDVSFLYLSYLSLK